MIFSQEREIRYCLNFQKDAILEDLKVGTILNRYISFKIFPGAISISCRKAVGQGDCFLLTNDERRALLREIHRKWTY
jgi:hypothetical protein